MISSCVEIGTHKLDAIRLKITSKNGLRYSTFVYSFSAIDNLREHAFHLFCFSSCSETTALLNSNEMHSLSSCMQI